MSTSPYWRPVELVKAHDLPIAIKYIIGPRYWDSDGTLSTFPRAIGPQEIPWLEGVVAAGKPDVEIAAKELIAAIQHYGMIEVWLEG